MHEPELNPGAKVRVRTGSLSGVEGTIIRKSGGDRFIVGICLIREGVNIQIDGYLLEVIAPPDGAAMPPATAESVDYTRASTKITCSTKMTTMTRDHHQFALRDDLLIRSWDVFAIILSKRVRERVYDPARFELLEDYLQQRSRFSGTKAERSWVRLCFAFRTAGLFWESLRVGCLGRIADIFMRAAPEVLKRWLLP